MNGALESMPPSPELCNSFTLLLDMGAEVANLSASRGDLSTRPMAMTLLATFATFSELEDCKIRSVQFLYLY